MSSLCAICGQGVVPHECGAYSIGGIRGRLCAECNSGMQDAVTAFVAGRMEQLQAQRAQAAKDARAKQEHDAAAVLAKEVAHSRLAAIAAEQFPRATRGEMARKGRAA